MAALNEAEAALSALTAKAAELRAERRQLETQIGEHNAAREPLRRAGSRYRAPDRRASRQKRGLFARGGTARGRRAPRSPARNHRGRHSNGGRHGRAIAHEGEGHARGGGSGAAEGEEPRDRGRDPYQAVEAGRGGPVQAHRRSDFGDAGLRDRARRSPWRRSRRDRRSSRAHPLVPRQRQRRRPGSAARRRAALLLRARPA